MSKNIFLETYYCKLRDALDASEASFIFNKDRSHNSTIMRFMFDNSQEVLMYCGSMSVFRNGFYKKIGTDEKVEDCEIISKEAKDNLLKSMRSFFEKKDARLNVILENYDPSYLDDLIDAPLFKENVEKGSLKICKLDDSFTFKKKLSHFSSSDKNIVRLEQDKIEHSAVCILNDENLQESSKKLFNKLSEVATPVEWPKQNLVL